MSGAFLRHLPSQGKEIVRRRREEPRHAQHISQSTTVDPYNEDERSMGWYYYLENAMSFPSFRPYLLPLRDAPVSRICEACSRN
ncbi:MAG: hypothetical protein GF418_12805 [Chitinivibrionales bacterium]|nr:hypothetical protein [Chitinivibrionales bacterium]MBD3396499.1 hypothetical protein [Chitinivibrionales bacterium]